MNHEVTIISDDLRHELGNTITLCGMYDDFLVFRSLPSRVLKLAFYQRWRDVLDLEKVTIELRGSALGEAVLRVEARPSAPTPGKPQLHPARILIYFGPLDFFKEGSLEFHTI